jgi:hypothetical protein
MVKTTLGALVAALAMFITGFIFYATPLGMIQYKSVGDTEQAAVQAALAANLSATGTGTYMVPSPATPDGTIMYGKGPIATVHYNGKGYSTTDASSMIGGFVQEFIVCLLLGFALSRLDRRVPDFASRARIVVGFSLAASVLINLGQPVWMHEDWFYALYAFVADAAMLAVAGLTIARWFLPTSAELPGVSARHNAQEASSAQEIPPVSGAGL